jgi:hypothetical protein
VLFAAAATTTTTATATAALATLGWALASAFTTIAVATTPIIAAKITPSTTRARTSIATRRPSTSRSARTRRRGCTIAIARRWSPSRRPAFTTAAEITTPSRTSAWTAALRPWTRTTRTTRTTGSGGTLFLGCTIDPDAAPVDLRTIELLERVLGSFFAGVRDEAEPARTTRVPVQDDAGIRHVTELGEHLLEAIVVHRPRQAADEQFCRHLSPLLDPGVSSAPSFQGTDADCQRQPRGCVQAPKFPECAN